METRSTPWSSEEAERFGSYSRKLKADSQRNKVGLELSRIQITTEEENYSFHRDEFSELLLFKDFTCLFS